MEEMQDKKRNRKIDIYFGLLFLIFSIGNWIYFYYSSSFYIFSLAFFISLITLNLLLNPFREYTIVKYILEIIGWILGIIYILITILLSFLLILLSSMIVLALFTLIFKGIILGLIYFDIVICKEPFEIPLLYCSILFTLVTLSYFGKDIIGVLDKILSVGATNKNELSRNIAMRILKFINLRRRIYELSIVLYVLAVIEDLSGITLFSIEVWENYKSISLEVLVTFVAIDGYVSNFIGYSKK